MIAVDQEAMRGCELEEERGVSCDVLLQGREQEVKSGAINSTKKTEALFW